MSKLIDMSISGSYSKGLQTRFSIICCQPVGGISKASFSQGVCRLMPTSSPNGGLDLF